MSNTQIFQNYQLYRTNVLLGGQMKYDLVLDNVDKYVCIKDFHITPISPAVPYNKHLKENLIKYSHNENISRYYKKISGSFYKDFADQKLTNLYPVFDYGAQKPKAIFDNTYEMGLRRAQYSIYNKQFEFFCPVWLEKLQKNESLCFVIELFTNPAQTTPISSTMLELDVYEDYNVNYSYPKYHNDVVRYFQNYFDSIGLYKGNNWVLDINDKNSTICGVDLDTGQAKLYSNKTLYNNIISRERPLIEVDNMIINELKNHKAITKQLFNFNLIFNLEDLYVSKLFDMFIASGASLYINVKAQIKNKDVYTDLNMKDIYSNYDFIGKTKSSPLLFTEDLNDEEGKPVYDLLERSNRNRLYLKEDKNITLNTSTTCPVCGKEDNNTIINTPNVLDYLEDYKCIDLIDKNKIVQSTIHWGYTFTPDTIFNVYNGFAGYFVNDDNKVSYSNHTNTDSPDIHLSVYNKDINQYWCNSIILSENIKSTMGYNQLIRFPWLYKKYFSKFNTSCVVKNINYSYDDVNNEYGDIGNIYVLLVVDKTEITSKLSITGGVVDCTPENYKGKCKCYINSNNIDEDNSHYIIILVNGNENKNLTLPLANARNIFDKIIKNGDNKIIEYKALELLNKILGSSFSSANNLYKYITLGGGLKSTLAKSPSLTSKEIIYYKSDHTQYIERMFGKIKPLFIDNDNDIYFNNMYYKVTVIDPNNSDKYYTGLYDKKYFLYQNSTYSAPAFFPSIGYYPYHKIDKISYQYDKDLYTVYDDSEHERQIKLFENIIEYRLFTYNKLINLTPEINVTLTSKLNNGKYTEVSELVKDYIADLYKGYDQNMIAYIQNLYEYRSDFLYSDSFENSSEYKDYIYNVKIKLK